MMTVVYHNEIIDDAFASFTIYIGIIYNYTIDTFNNSNKKSLDFDLIIFLNAKLKFE